MRILLINVNGNITSDGARIILSLLKRGGHQVRSVYLARETPLEYDPAELEPLKDLLQDVDLVLVSVYSAYALRAVQVTECVRRNSPHIKVFWGGPHCIGAPELSLRHADGVCFAEGDEVIVDLVNRMESGTPWIDTPNMAFNSGEAVKVNAVLPPFSRLDDLPVPDFSFSEQYLLDRKLSALTEADLYLRSPVYPIGVPSYYLLTSRGCHQRCSYCNNIRFISLHGGNPLRFRSLDNALEELEEVLPKYPSFRAVGIGDDDFFLRSLKDLDHFAGRYKRNIDLPLWVNVSANTFRREKMEALLDSGLKITLQMGVQSGSQRVLDEVFHRRIKVSKTREVLARTSEYRGRGNLTMLLDFIIDNPFETRKDIAETFHYLVDIPPGVTTNLFWLSFFPGTPLYDRAVKEGVIEPFDERELRPFHLGNVRYQKNWETALLFLAVLTHRHRPPSAMTKAILHAIGSSPVRAVSTLLPTGLFSLLIERLKKSLYGVKA